MLLLSLVLSFTFCPLYMHKQFTSPNIKTRKFPGNNYRQPKNKNKLLFNTCSFSIRFIIYH